VLLTVFALRLMAVIPWLSTDCIKNGIENNAHLENERSLLIKIYLYVVGNATFKVVVIVASTLLVWEVKSERH